MIARIKKDDMVFVLSGKDKGKTGKVIALWSKKQRVMVQGVAVQVKHKKAKRSGQEAGIKHEESFINIAKVMPVCTSCNNPTRINVKVLESGKRSRICNHCREIF